MCNAADRLKQGRAGADLSYHLFSRYTDTGMSVLGQALTSSSAWGIEGPGPDVISPSSGEEEKRKKGRNEKDRGCQGMIKAAIGLSLFVQHSMLTSTGTKNRISLLGPTDCLYFLSYIRELIRSVPSRKIRCLERGLSMSCRTTWTHAFDRDGEGPSQPYRYPSSPWRQYAVHPEVSIMDRGEGRLFEESHRSRHFEQGFRHIRRMVCSRRTKQWGGASPSQNLGGGCIIWFV